MDNAIIIGAGTYGAVYAEYLLETKKYNIIGFLDDDESKFGKLLNGIKVIGNVSELEKLSEIEDSLCVFVPIGSNEVRKRIIEYARKLRHKTPSFIHPSAIIHNSVNIGDTVYVLPGSQIMPFVTIEDNVMISMGVNIAHHSILNSNCFISQGSNVGASITIEESAFLGIGSTIMTGVKSVGSNSIIGAGAVIIKDVPDYAVVVGNPGRIIKYNKNS